MHTVKLLSFKKEKNTVFSVEKDSKNQNKTTIKIRSKSGIQIAYKVEEPKHKSVRKEME